MSEVPDALVEKAAQAAHEYHRAYTVEPPCERCYVQSRMALGAVLPGVLEERAAMVEELHHRIEQAEDTRRVDELAGCRHNRHA